jgi:YVTN family beta-propeller protein
MRARWGHHAGAGHRGGTSARWRGAAVVAAAALSLAAGGAVPAAAAVGGYTVTATIPVGSFPEGVAVDPATHTAYVANSGAATVSVIDAATSTVTATIPVGTHPHGVGADPVTHTAYATNYNDGTVSVIDEATSTVTATIPVGSFPIGVAVDPAAHTAYVTNYFAGTVSVISAPAPLPAPVTTVTSSRNPAAAGRAVTFTATVGPTDGGTVTFTSGPATLCSAVPLTDVTGSTYQATCTTTALPVGRDTITAAYPGDASYAASAGTLTQTITAAKVTRARTALTARIRRSGDDALTLTATLTSSGHPLTRQPVTFTIRHTRLCTAHTNRRGVATCVLTSQAHQAEKDHVTIRASYPGNTRYRPSTATATAPSWWW